MLYYSTKVQIPTPLGVVNCRGIVSALLAIAGNFVGAAPPELLPPLAPLQCVSLGAAMSASALSLLGRILGARRLERMAAMQERHDTGAIKALSGAFKALSGAIKALSGAFKALMLGARRLERMAAMQRHDSGVLMY